MVSLRQTHSHISGWNPINGIYERPAENRAHKKSDTAYGHQNALDEEPIDPGFEEKYFDHYGYLNYVNSPHKEDTTSSNSILERTPKQLKNSHAYLSRETDEPTDLWEHDAVFTQHATSSKKLWKPYTAEEDAWLDLFHAKIRSAIEAGAVIRIPGPITVLEAFNAFFKNKYSVEEEEDGVIAGDSEWMPRTFGSMHRKLRWGGGK
ncbi:hypothetical protein GGP41_001876 [Bipolaris sorokiniana]|uniref:Uncharacterized protein n=1 Tax=Cochliobolus sativus TaxID=45130 RepID=A0A8H5ZQ59_COCSA|nr:hypothetical protein GGP41_001876 [Bipolaris sorokiniana]